MPEQMAMGAAQFDFGGRRVLVTGASRGIGLGVAEAFVRANALVTIIADDAAVHDVAKQLGANHDAAVDAIECDITDSAAVESSITELDGIDVLINNAGLEQITPITDNDEETVERFRRIVDINVMGTYHVTRAVVPNLSDGGSIVQTCSIWSHTAVAEFSAYCSTKHANLGFVRSMAAELATRGIRVNGVSPGWVKTRASMRSLADMAVRTGESEDALLDEIVAAQLLSSLMDPADVAPTYLFLCSDAAASITGQTIIVDRGSRAT